MTWLQFTAEMTKALAWPGVVLACVAIFYRALRDRIPDLQSFSLPGGVKFDFSKALKEAAAEAEQLPPLDSEQTAQSSAINSAPSSIPAHLRVIQAWMQIESELRQVAQVIPLRGQTPGRWVAELKEARLIDPRAAEILNELRQLRNRAAHGETSISENDASGYEQLALEMIDRLAFAAALTLNMREPRHEDTRHF
jgi:Domain of unknown function (DUF4145)